jgi:hypothetical protein
VVLQVAAIHAAMNDLAVLTIESSEACDVIERGGSPRAGFWPPPSTWESSLTAAIRFLD